MKTTPYIEGNTLTECQTLVSDNRLANLIMYSYHAKQIAGAYAEFGVFRGGGTELLAKINPEKYIFSIDSFEGLPQPTKVDKHKKGDFKEVDFNELHEWFKVKYPNVRLMKGFSPNIFTELDDIEFAFVHVDVDLYQSVKDACDFFYPRLSKGGIMLFDDYKFDSTPGAALAIHEYFNSCLVTIQQELKYADGKSHNQYLIIK